MCSDKVGKYYMRIQLQHATKHAIKAWVREMHCSDNTTSSSHILTPSVSHGLVAAMHAALTHLCEEALLGPLLLLLLKGREGTHTHRKGEVIKRMLPFVFWHCAAYEILVSRPVLGEWMLLILPVRWESIENGNKSDSDPQALWGKRERKLRSFECTLPEYKQIHNSSSSQFWFWFIPLVSVEELLNIIVF